MGKVTHYEITTIRLRQLLLSTKFVPSSDIKLEIYLGERKISRGKLYINFEPRFRILFFDLSKGKKKRREFLLIKKSYTSDVWKGKYISFEQLVLWLKINNFDTIRSFISYNAYMNLIVEQKVLLRKDRWTFKCKKFWATNELFELKLLRDGLSWNQVWLENSEQEFNEVLWILKNHSSERGIIRNFSSYVLRKE